MKLEKILPFASRLLKDSLTPGDIAVDGTVGNGFDTVFLADLVGEEGHVYGFDIQQAAIDQTEKKLASEKVTERCTLFTAGHEQVTYRIPEKHHGQIKAAIFNLGYLPGGDKSIITHFETTISSVEQLLDIMAPGGMIVLVIYHGHPGGAEERDHLLEYAAALSQHRAHVLQYQFINQVNDPPFILAIEKI